MFWTQRLKQADVHADGSWLSFGDLMSLLLVVFVMVTAMSELRADDRFGRISAGVRQAFGFSASGGAGADVSMAGSRSLTLLERLEQAGFRRQSSVQLIGPDDEVLAPCDVIVGEKTITLRIAGHASFARGSAALERTGAKALREVAEYLAGGTCRLEVRGYGDRETLPPEAAFRDGMDLAYARARAVADALAARGVERERLSVTVWAEPTAGFDAENRSGLPNSEAPVALPEGAERRIEIVVHGTSVAGHDQSIAGKDRSNDG